MGHPLGQLRDDLGCAIEVVEDDEALEVDALDEEVAEVARAGRHGRRVVVVGGDQSAEGHARPDVQAREDRLRDLAATFSKSTSIPSGVAALSRSCQSRAW